MKFISHLSETFLPLTSLLCKDMSWTWSSAQQDAIEKAKDLVTSALILAFYNPVKNWSLNVMQLSMALGQLSSNFQEGRPLVFASLTLSDPERSLLRPWPQKMPVFLGQCWHLGPHSPVLIRVGVNSGVGVGVGFNSNSNSGVGVGIGVETSGVGVGVGVDILEIGRSWSWSWNSWSWSWSWSWYSRDLPELELELELKLLGVGIGVEIL